MFIKFLTFILLISISTEKAIVGTNIGGWMVLGILKINIKNLLSKYNLKIKK